MSPSGAIALVLAVAALNCATSLSISDLFAGIIATPSPPEGNCTGGVHDVWSNCTSLCPQTCDEPYPGPCPEVCIHGCKCDIGYYRRSDECCVLYGQCNQTEPCPT